MKFLKFNKKTIFNVIIILAVVFTVVAAVYAVTSGKSYFTRRSIRTFGQEIKSFGIWSPLMIFALILITTLVPPIPLPTNLLEAAGGLIFGFWPGLVLIWASMLISNICAFFLSKIIGKRYLSTLSNNKFIGFYKKYLDRRGALAVFVFRATMSMPFNISYLAGLVQMKWHKFTLATALGLLPETVLFVYLGSLISERMRLHIRLSLIVVILIILSILPSLILWLIGYFQSKKNKLSIKQL